MNNVAVNSKPKYTLKFDFPKQDHQIGNVSEKRISLAAEPEPLGRHH